MDTYTAVGLPRCGLYSWTNLPKILRLIWSVYCHFSSLIRFTYKKTLNGFSFALFFSIQQLKQVSCAYQSIIQNNKMKTHTKRATCAASTSSQSSPVKDATVDDTETYTSQALNSKLTTAQFFCVFSALWQSVQKKNKPLFWLELYVLIFFLTTAQCTRVFQQYCRLFSIGYTISILRLQILK